MIFGLAGLVSSATITVSSPSDVSEWMTGKNHTIQWISSGNPSSHVDIFLFDGTASTKIMDIDLNTANDGRYEWNLPLFLKKGNYVIRIKARGNPTFGDSAVFNISNPPSGEMIQVQAPHDGAQWEIGGSYRIIWNASETLPSRVDISLCNESGNRRISPIGMNVPNSGSFLWTISPSIPAGRYVVCVQSKGHPASDLSAEFFISDKKAPVMRNLLSPGHRSRWQRGKMMPVRWRVSESGNRKAGARVKYPVAPHREHERVRIQYVKVAGQSLRKPLSNMWLTIQASAPNTGNYSWLVPEKLAPGFYIVRISEIYSPPDREGKILSMSESDIFEIY
jgi:hypothetical protein